MQSSVRQLGWNAEAYCMQARGADKNAGFILNHGVISKDGRKKPLFFKTSAKTNQSVNKH
jgi:hypothetical protein